METTNYEELIQAARDFRHGAMQRQNAYTEGSPNEQFFSGKVEGYNDIIAFLIYKMKEEMQEGLAR